VSVTTRPETGRFDEVTCLEPSPSVSHSSASIRWARHVAVVGHWRAGAVSALRATGQALSLARWRACTDAACPPPPGWRTLAEVERLALAALVAAQPSVSARPLSDAQVRQHKKLNEILWESNGD
jgi:hypothetical protein